MTSQSSILTPEERRRRDAVLAKSIRIVKRLGFRRVAARPGWWYHDDLGPEKTFPLTVEHAPVEGTGEVLCQVFDHGHAHGQVSIQRLIKQAAGL